MYITLHMQHVTRHHNMVTTTKRSMWVTLCRPLVAMAAAQLKSTSSHQGLDSEETSAWLWVFFGHGVAQKEVLRESPNTLN